MSVEAFLSFWDHYNTVIIQFLIGVVLFITVYVAYRTFFGEDEAAATPGGASFDVGALEKTLQKLLESQNAGPKSAGGASPGAEAPAGGSTGVSGAEVEKLKADLAEKEKALADLQAAGVAGAAQEKTKLEERVKDLEARLAEYEIISEDIADLSFYKEENGKLQKELETLRKTGAAPAVAQAAPAVEPAPVAAAPEPALTAEPVAAPAPPEPAPPPLVEPPPAAPAAADEALKQMAAAATSTPAPANPDDSKLMNQFEDFVKKG